MKSKNLTITVSGTALSGKSTITYLLKQFLKEQGFEVEQEYNIDHSTEENFNIALNVIKEKSKITLKETQLNRRMLQPTNM